MPFDEEMENLSQKTHRHSETPVVATEADEAKAKAKVLSGLAAKKETPVVATEADEAKARAKVQPVSVNA